ncbi:exodeoxyribonuclease VII large subunit [Cyanobium sp. CH-040]|uniref:exodeoxyribonuclease VII large subunit n=1 Tax=Cyanobium sp. CH-040 TaxID=2823708 RepID=UPI0020CD22BE|nr:exodeoxyribonuclease VII large subunit [Cyanobium sp. CH-040]MCP9927225.1 exodeoxyribonuclease VII large subunit [Cyanobium sp. CH-040]
MTEPPLPRYSVTSLNRAVATLLERGFAPRFLLDATVSRPQVRKGHLWMDLVDETASISGVVWASQLAKLSFQPAEGDGVVVVGKLNFWATRASLSVQILDLRPSLSSVLRRFERVRDRLEPEGLFDPRRKRPLPDTPACIALLTSVPSSALADMLRTAAERWPATRVLVVPIPVQGNAEEQIAMALERLCTRAETLGVEAIVLARGGGNREDLAVFDGERLARCIAASTVPVVSGIGHEDDTTIADLVADYRAATPTAALVALLPDQHLAASALQQLRRHLTQVVGLRLQGERQQLGGLLERLAQLHPRGQLDRRRLDLERSRVLLEALSPQHALARGFALLRTADGGLVRSTSQLHPGDGVLLTLADGRAEALVQQVEAAPAEWLGQS